MSNVLWLDLYYQPLCSLFFISIFFSKKKRKKRKKKKLHSQFTVTGWPVLWKKVMNERVSKLYLSPVIDLRSYEQPQNGMLSPTWDGKQKRHENCGIINHVSLIKKGEYEVKLHLFWNIVIEKKVCAWFVGHFECCLHFIHANSGRKLRNFTTKAFSKVQQY